MTHPAPPQWQHPYHPEQPVHPEQQISAAHPAAGYGQGHLYGNSPSYVPHGFHPSPPVRPVSGFSVAALTVGIVTLMGGFFLVFPIVLTWIFAHAGLNETKTGMKAGRGMAIAGNVLGWVAFLPTLFWIMRLVFGALNT